MTYYTCRDLHLPCKRVSVPLPCVSLAPSSTFLAEVKLFIPCGDAAFPLSLQYCTCPMLVWHMLASSWQRLRDNSFPQGPLFGKRLKQAIPAHLCISTSLAAFHEFNPSTLCLGQISSFCSAVAHHSGYQLQNYCGTRVTGFHLEVKCHVRVFRKSFRSSNY